MHYTYRLSTTAIEAAALSDAELRRRVCSDLLHTSGALPTLRDQLVDYIRILDGEADTDSRATLRIARATLARADRLSLECPD